MIVDREDGGKAFANLHKNDVVAPGVVVGPRRWAESKVKVAE